MNKFPIELIIEIIISFIMVVYASLFEYMKLKEIFKDKQKDIIFEDYKPAYNHMQSKGGMLNFYTKEDKK